jgi:hypothetical protein
VGTVDSYIYYNALGMWLASTNLGATAAYFLSMGDSLTPPLTGWHYAANGGWQSGDASFELREESLRPCEIVVVAATGDAASWNPSSIGLYHLTGNWSAGRPVFRHERGDRVLLVKEGYSYWEIAPTIADTSSWIKSGRATDSPDQPEAGPSERWGTTGWRYASQGIWEDSKGTIELTCHITGVEVYLNLHVKPPPSGSWSAWGPWSPCSCHPDTWTLKTRTRVCQSNSSSSHTPICPDGEVLDSGTCPGQEEELGCGPPRGWYLNLPMVLLLEYACL